MQTCDQCGTRAPQLPVRIEIVRESGPIGLTRAPGPGETINFTKGYTFCQSDHAYEWARERRYMICNRQPTSFEAGIGGSIGSWRTSTTWRTSRR